MSSQLANPRIGHLKEVLHILSYLKREPKKTLFFKTAYHVGDERRFKKCDRSDFYGKVEKPILGDMPVPRGNFVDTTCFVDASHAFCLKTRRSQIGILIFFNKAPITWHSKRQNAVESSTFSSEFIAMKVAVEMMEALRLQISLLTDCARVKGIAAQKSLVFLYKVTEDVHKNGIGHDEMWFYYSYAYVCHISRLCYGFFVTYGVSF
jgi:hypothetical protein